MNKETLEELNAAEQVKRALQNSQKGLGLYGAEMIEKLIARIRYQDRKIERYENGEPSPVIREHVESLQRTIASQSEKINAMRGTIDRLTARETPESRMKDGVCFRSVKE
jgi:hypothetical protein